MKSLIDRIPGAISSKRENLFLKTAFLLIIILFTISNIVSFLSEYRSQIYQLENEIDSIVELSENTLSSSLWAFDRGTITSTGNALKNNQHMILVRISDFNEREVFYHQVSEDPIPEEHMIYRSSIISYSSRPIGILEYGYTPFYIQKELRQALFRNIVQFLIILLLLWLIFIKTSKGIIKELEERVEKRTQELQAATNHIIQMDKMASLGEIVGGVAHEINTPLGVSLSSLSYINSIHQDMLQSLKDSTMTKGDLKNYFVEMEESLEILENNLNRSADLVQSFKQVSIDQKVDQLDSVSLYPYFEMIIKSLKHEYKNGNHRIDLIGEKEISINTYPGALSQIISNLIMNSIKHGFGDTTNGIITIELKADKDDVTILYQDNGQGVKEEDQPKIFDMFYTTDRKGGGSGLGLSIVYNLVHHKLNGELHFSSEPDQGVLFAILLPKQQPS
ncbi:sensor histidine kinase [Tindallia californiensis]|uniref:histidine kinase n=1 Tax=Tindallia californiensis TaxID=159292 RepID=A0A1H3QT03_9FIRM|nr:HAMP domain-containing sensor histidine kinase [Tindallia californiensis]SDZ16128.1 Signal transduction histidine kinase [Tindallia californiensis]